MPHPPLSRYAGGLAALALATLAGAAVRPWFDPIDLVMIFLLTVVVVAFYFGRGPSVVVSVLAVLAFDFLFVPPQLTFAVSDSKYLLSFAGLLIVGLVISQLTARVRDQADAASRRAAETAALYAQSRELAVSAGIDDVVGAISRNIGETFHRPVLVLLPDPKTGTLDKTGTAASFQMTDADRTAALSAYQGQPSGANSHGETSDGSFYLPLKTARGVLGVLAVGPGTNGSLAPEETTLLDAFASLAAVAIERTQLADAAQKAQLLEATEKLQRALLNSISHDLRTPLVSITGVLTSLQDDATRLDEATRANLVDTAREDADRLNRLVGNLLDMTRIQSGAMRVVKEPVEVQDLVGAALEPFRNRIAGRPLTVDAPPDLPLTPMDPDLMVQVLVNIVDNALKYSPPGTPVEITATRSGDWLEITVADRGIGIPREDLQRVFDAFYRVQRPNQAKGTGMGLAICKGIVEAHGGQIAAENRPGGGAVIRVRLPLDGRESSTGEPTR